ncbi:MAG: hypothetical protein GX684_06375 [Ruminococcaceae bacterium]|nr:hypothetical protein [Oscillospiraceae bacterium]
MKKANKSKKFLSLLIALVLLLGLMPIASITARAEEIIIDKIEITGVTAPVAGEKPTYDGITLKTAEAEILGKSWLVFTGKDDFVHSASKPFESGQTYSISFGLKPKDGYKFAEETTATVNEKPATVTVGGEGNAYRSVKLTFKITPGEPEKVTLSFDPGRGTGEMEPVTVDKYRLFVLPAHDFTGPGDKEFVAWGFVGSDNIAAGDTISIGSNVTATAIWEEEIIRHVDRH